MNWQTVFSLIVAVASSTVLTQGVQAIIQRRKVKVDATEVLSDTALSQLAAMKADLREARDDVDKMRDEQRAFRKVLYQHEKWDRMVIAKLDSLGVPVPDAPELWL